MGNELSRRRVLQGLAVGTVGTIAGCAGGLTDAANGTQQPNSGQANGAGATATIALDSEPVAGEWSSYGGITPYYTPIHETLTRASPDLKEVVPGLSIEWESLNEQTWEFTLREDVVFHSGEPLDAAAAAESLTRLFAENEDEYTWTKLTAESFRAVDERTLEVVTTESLPATPGNLAHPLMKLQYRSGENITRPIGTGPFRVQSVAEGEPVVASAFEEYWRGTPPLSELTIRGITDPNTRALSLEADEVDVAIDLPKERFDSLQDTENVTVRTQTEPRAGLTMVNLYRPPTDDETLRRALEYAVDQEAIVRNLLEGIGKPAKAPFSSVVPFSAHDELPTYGPDLERATQLVDKSDYSGESLNFIVESEATEQQLIAERMQQSFAEIGVNVNVQLVEAASFFDTYLSGEANLTFVELGSINGVADYLVYLMFHSQGGDNVEMYQKNGTGVVSPGPEVNHLIERGDSAWDEANKYEAYREVQRRVMQTGAVIPVYYKEYILGSRAAFTGPKLHAIPHMIDWTTLRTED